VASKDQEALECLAEGNDHSPAGSMGVNCSPEAFKARVVCYVWWLFTCCLREQTNLLLALRWPGLCIQGGTLLPWPDPDPGAQQEEDDWEGESMGAIFAPYPYLVRLQDGVLHCCLLPRLLCGSQVFTIDRL